MWFCVVCLAKTAHLKVIHCPCAHWQHVRQGRGSCVLLKAAAAGPLQQVKLIGLIGLIGLCYVREHLADEMRPYPSH